MQGDRENQNARDSAGEGAAAKPRNTLRKRLTLSLLVLSLLFVGVVIGFAFVTAKGGTSGTSDRGQDSEDDVRPDRFGTQNGTSGAAGSKASGTGSEGAGTTGSDGSDVSGNNAAADFVSGSFLSDNPDDPRPKDCQLTPGETCPVRFLGSVRLATSESGTIVVSAHEDGAEKPVTSASLPVSKGSFRWPLKLTYVVSLQARNVQFKVVLLDASGNQIAAQYPPGPVVPISR